MGARDQSSRAKKKTKTSPRGAAQLFTYFIHADFMSVRVRLPVSHLARSRITTCCCSTNEPPLSARGGKAKAQGAGERVRPDTVAAAARSVVARPALRVRPGAEQTKNLSLILVIPGYVVKSFNTTDGTDTTGAPIPPRKRDGAMDGPEPSGMLQWVLVRAPSAPHVAPHVALHVASHVATHMSPL